MKRTFTDTIWLLAVMLVLTSCGLVGCSDSNDDTPSTPIAHITIIQAQTESADGSRTALSGNDGAGYNVVWQTGDMIYVTNRANATNKYKQHDGEGRTNATFFAEGDIIDYDQPQWSLGDAHVFYGITSNDNYRTLSWPKYQSYAQLNDINFSPMYATFRPNDVTTTQGPTLHFQNLGGLLRLTVKGTSTIGRIKMISDDALCGEFTLENATDDAQKKMAYLTGNNDHSITLNCGGVALSESGTDFYIALPEGSYRGVRLDFYDQHDNLINYMRLNDSYRITIKRSKITDVPVHVYPEIDDVDLNIYERGGEVGDGKDTERQPDKAYKVFFAKFNYGATYSNPIGVQQEWPGSTKTLVPGSTKWYYTNEWEMTKLFRNTMLAPTHWNEAASESGSNWIWTNDKSNDEYTWTMRAEADGIRYVTVSSIFTGKSLDLPVAINEGPTQFWVVGNGTNDYTGISFGFQTINYPTQITTSISKTTRKVLSERGKNLLYIHPAYVETTPTEVKGITKGGKQYVLGGWSEIFPQQQ